MEAATEPLRTIHRLQARKPAEREAAGKGLPTARRARQGQAQADAQHKQMTGQQPTDDEIKNIQNLAKEVSGKKVVQDLMNQERQVDSMLQQLNKTITSPIQDLYSEVMPKMPGQE